MKTVLRIIISLSLTVWLGAELFFPIVAAIAFTTLTPDTHTAGRIVGSCLRVLHYEGLVAGVLLIVCLLLAGRMAMFRPRNLRIALVLVVGMITLTAISQFGIIPHMESYRIAAGGAIDTAAPGDPARVAFERLHKTSEHVEVAILVFGLIVAGIAATQRYAKD